MRLQSHRQFVGLALSAIFLIAASAAATSFDGRAAVAGVFMAILCAGVFVITAEHPVAGLPSIP
jgi:hypothetical protein